MFIVGVVFYLMIGVYLTKPDADWYNAIVIPLLWPLIIMICAFILLILPPGDSHE